MAAVVMAATVLGCGGSDFSNSESGGAGGTSGAGGSSGDGGVAGSTQVPLDQQIDPITVGRKWTYDVIVYGNYAYCKQGVYSGETLSEKELAGRHSYQVQSLCPGAGVSSYSVDGDRVWLYYAGSWALALDAPVEEGHTWSNGLVNVSWEWAGSVTVAAGTFDDCWTAREQVASEEFTIFCRGVGPIHWHSKSAAGNGFDAQLVGKNF